MDILHDGWVGQRLQIVLGLSGKDRFHAKFRQLPASRSRESPNHEDRLRNVPWRCLGPNRQADRFPQFRIDRGGGARILRQGYQKNNALV